MKKVLTVGVFDFFHLGHLNILEQAKKQGDYLIVAVHDDEKNSKGVEFLYSLEQRMYMVGALKCVNEVVSYKRVDLAVKKIKPDIFVYGPDQEHKYFQEAFLWCQNNNIKMVKILRTKGISSSKIRAILKDKEV